jgi:hypothetical protein
MPNACSISDFTDEVIEADVDCKLFVRIHQ